MNGDEQSGLWSWNELTQPTACGNQVQELYCVQSTSTQVTSFTSGVENLSNLTVFRQCSALSRLRSAEKVQEAGSEYWIVL